MDQEKRFMSASELLVKPEFVEELKSAETDEDVQQLFAKHGVELSLEDIAQMVKESAINAGKEELGEDSLESVSGGVVLTTLACFAIGGAALGFFVGYGSRASKIKR